MSRDANGVRLGELLAKGARVLAPGVGTPLHRHGNPSEEKQSSSRGVTGCALCTEVDSQHEITWACSV